MPSNNPRLQFTDAELEPRLKEPVRRAGKAADQAEKARAKIPKDRKKVKRRMADRHTGKAKKRLRFEETDRPAPPSKLSHAVHQAPGPALSAQAHGEVREAERENVGVESVYKLELTAESGGRVLESAHHSHKLKPYRTAARAERRLEKANLNALYRKHVRDDPGHADSASNALSRWQQKRAIRKQYAASIRSGQGVAAAMGNPVNAAKMAARSSGKAAAFFSRHKRGFLAVVGIGLAAAFLISCVSSCSVLLEAGLSALNASTYPASEADLLGAEAAYAGMEADLQHELDNYETLHSGYDEYRYELDAIGHDPYVLVSMLSALYPGGWTLESVRDTLEMLFDRQYILTVSVETETRYDEDDEPCGYTICTVKLVNFDLARLTAYLLNEEQLAAYSLYMRTLGNRPDLFPRSEYPNASRHEDYLDYDVPPEALEDEVFAAMLAEAEKYLGYPYVWGGSNPSTSFDCSGFVSWVINHSGWNVGRLGAQGLYNICTPVSPVNARPGDLVFFKHTYNAPDPDGVTHVGIYVGNGMMIHCGNPISYANLNSSYWQEHFWSFARLP